MPSQTQPGNAAPTGGSWASGAGHTQTSGTPVEYAEYKQWLTIDYTRNPTYANKQTDTVFRSLGTVSATEDWNVNGSNIHFNITTHNSCTIVSGNYDNSTSYQSQKFAVMANKTDKAGHTYGEVSGASSLYVFGPQGSIITTQPMIRRQAKTAVDVAYHLTQYGTTHGLQTSGFPYTTYTWGQSDLIGQDYDTYLRSWNDICKGGDYPYAKWSSGWTFKMYGGAYSTTAEPGYEDNAAGLQNLINFLEINCTYLGSTSWASRFVNWTVVGSEGQSYVQETDRLARNPYYNTAFHDYN